MRQSPSIVPLDRLDRDIYLVLEDFGVRAGCAWRDLETVRRDVLSGQYAYPLRIVCFNAVEGWARDAASEVVDALVARAAETDAQFSPALQAFIQANATRPINVHVSKQTVSFSELAKMIGFTYFSGLKCYLPGLASYCT